jgi:molecular chaperone GrpE (heat shock protein)
MTKEELQRQINELQSQLDEMPTDTEDALIRALKEIEQLKQKIFDLVSRINSLELEKLPVKPIPWTVPYPQEPIFPKLPPAPWKYENPYYRD